MNTPATTASGIYEIRNLVNGKRYVGSAVSFWNRWRIHAQSLARGDHHSKQLQRSWLKYGPFAFQFNKLLACKKDDLLMYEQICIDHYKPEYNSAPRAGSNLGLRMREESKALLAEAARRTRNFTGKTHSAESRAKISANRKGKGGGPRTPERLAKIGAAHRGKPKSAAQRAKISATLTGTSTGRGKLTDEQVRSIRQLYASGLRQIDIANRLGLAPKFVHTVVRRHGYTWVN